MKKLIAIVLVLLMMIPVGAVAAFADETPTTTSPKYEPTPDWGPNEDGNFEIGTPGDLLAMVSNRGKYNSYKDAKILLTADIDLNPGWDASSKTKPTNVWSYMEHIRGEFDGQGHTIRGLYSDARTQPDGKKGTASGDAVFVRSSLYGLTMRNFRLENTYFVADTGTAALVQYTRGKVVLENIYVDAIFESYSLTEDGALAGRAAGLVGFFRATKASQTPDLTLNNCVFAGTAKGGEYAGGIVGTNLRPGVDDEKGKGMYTINMTDCANYGTVLGMHASTPVAGLVGSLANEANLTRCYNAGTVGVAIANITKSTKALDEGTATVTLEDCYYLAGTGVVDMTTALDMTSTVVIKYSDATANATEVKAATAAELVAIDAFKNAGWLLVEDKAVPASVKCLVTGHIYNDTVVAPDGCKADGYTLHTCTVCGSNYKDTIVPAAAHTYVDTVVAPTCSVKGYTEHKCSVCEDTYTDNEVDMIAHTESDWIVLKDATEEMAGLRQKVCTVCEASLEQEVIPALTPETNAPETNAPETTAAPETEAPDEGGCGSSIALGSAFAMITMMSLGATVLRKKER